ncbi:MAG: NAD(P)/FAD-dependent oxidoreductase [Methanobacteriaceae archaeon]|nr:NAD(P)/FAD-dependent oxidoreductase [Methanobacteriaceae archaeon]
MTHDKFDYDVIVVGGGPIGSTFARYMAEKNYKVVILDKKTKIGVPLQCAGLLGTKVKELNILPSHIIINKVNGAFLHSPSNHTLHVSKKEAAAYLLDRVAYDQFLSQKAVDQGSELLLGHKVFDADLKKGEVKVKYKNQIKKLKSKVIIDAGGHSSIVSRQFNPQPKTFEAIQYMVKTDQTILDSENVHLHVNSKISPGFIWVIPLNDSMARIGMFSRLDYIKMDNILSDFVEKNEAFEKSKILKKYHGYIPQYDPKKKLVKDRTILLGDAASQVKPTTGGGLLIGFECAKIAADVVEKALANDDIEILTDYQRIFNKKFKSELNVQLQIQKTFELMQDRELDSMFLKLKKEGAEQIISECGDMDSQSPLIKEMIKSGIIFSVLPKIFFRRITNLWKST